MFLLYFFKLPWPSRLWKKRYIWENYTTFYSLEYILFANASETIICFRFLFQETIFSLLKLYIARDKKKDAASNSEHVAMLKSLASIFCMQLLRLCCPLSSLCKIENQIFERLRLKHWLKKETVFGYSYE